MEPWKDSLKARISNIKIVVIIKELGGAGARGPPQICPFIHTKATTKRYHYLFIYIHTCGCGCVNRPSKTQKLLIRLAQLEEGCS